MVIDTEVHSSPFNDISVSQRPVTAQSGGGEAKSNERDMLEANPLILCQ